jgi:hypothetical protein
MSGCPPSGKRAFETYAEALQDLDSRDSMDVLQGQVGSIYTCPNCGAFHLSSRYYFTLRKRKGRGKQRRGMVFSDKEEA